MRCLLIVLFALASIYPLAAQKKFSSGFIVTLKNDTVKGFLMDGTDAELGSKITFKMIKTANDKIEYRPADLLSFGFDNGRIFRSLASTNTPTEGDSVFVFAKKILEGKINLYTYSKAKGNHPDIFLVNNYSGKIIYLKEPEKVSTTNENGVVRTVESFRHLGLISIAKGGSVLNSKNANKFKYSEKAIR